MVRAVYVDKNGVKKGAWTEEEDNKLRAYILRYGHWNWRLLPKFAGLERCGKSCRLRWMNYLKPGLKRGDYSQEERDLIAKLYHELGNKWSAIAAKLPGRTDNDIKNYCHTHLKNRLKITSKSVQQAEISQQEQFEQGFQGSDATPVAPKTSSKKSEKSGVFILESSSPNSPVVSAAPDSSSEDSSAEQNCPEISSINLGANGDIGSFSDLLASGFHESFWSQPFMVDTYTYNHDYNFCPLDEGGLLSPRLSCFDDNAINTF